MMRLCAVLLFVLAFVGPTRAFAQQERVTFNLQDVTVKEVLDEIQKQTNLSFCSTRRRRPRWDE